MLKLRSKGSEVEEFYVFEYADPDRHILKRVTLLIVEPIHEAPTVCLPLQSEKEGRLIIETPPDKDIFTVKC